VRTILLVDDEIGSIDVLAAALEDEGYRVFTAANGRRGIDRLAENKPDLVISDFMMPLMNGAAMASAMRDNPAYRDIPIIMTSAAPEAALRERFQGYQAFLRKPFRVADLLDAIASVLGESPKQEPGSAPTHES
jgi:CheY-like chemotaxis protein